VPVGYAAPARAKGGKGKRAGREEAGAGTTGDTRPGKGRGDTPPAREVVK
jgi:hypothetical protein